MTYTREAGTWNTDSYGAAKIYLDGTLISQPSVRKSSYWANALSFGYNGDPTPNEYSAFGAYEIDEAFVWNKILSENDIATLNENSISGSEDNLIGFWKFNSGSGDILYDHSGNQAHGTIVGATWQSLNQSPVASNVTASIAEDTNYSGTLSGSDANGDALTYAIASNPSNGTVTINSSSAGTFTYSPTANYNGLDTFTCKAHDGTVTSSAASVTCDICCK